MRRIGVIAVGVALLGLLLTLSVSRRPTEEPEAAPASAPALAAELPAAEAALQPSRAPQLRAAPTPEPGESALAADPVEPGELDPAPVPLEKLLTWEQVRPAPRGLDLGRAAGPEAQAAPGDPGIRDRVYLERRTDELEPGDRERKLETTDVGVRVPVGKSVEVRSGVRIESRQDGETQADEAAPTVGVGVRF